MKLRYFIFSFLVVTTIGFISHFAYDILDFPFLKVIFPYNESVFEHLKLIVFPAIGFMIFDYFFTKDKKTFSINVFALIIAMISMIVLYYTYSGILGFDIDIVNIIIFYLSFVVFFIIRYKKITPFDNTNSVIALIIILIFIEVFTFFPLEIQFFNSKPL